MSFKQWLIGEKRGKFALLHHAHILLCHFVPHFGPVFSGFWSPRAQIPNIYGASAGDTHQIHSPLLGSTLLIFAALSTSWSHGYGVAGDDLKTS